MTAHATLIALRDATSAPPLDAELDDLLVAFEAMHARRQAILDAVPGRLRPATEADAMLLDEIHLREAIWQASLEAARAAIGGQRIHNSQLRAYAAAL
jgi:hypothetical protein